MAGPVASHPARRAKPLEDSTGSLHQRAAAFDHANITRTFAGVGPDDWDRAVTALSGRRAVYVLGLRKCYSAAYLLGRVRDDVRCLSVGSGMLTDELRHVGPGDCFVGISIHRYTCETVRGLRYAARRGATTIAITDNESSPLSRAGMTSYVDTTGVSILRSLTAVTSLSQALATDVAARRGKRARSALLFEETLLTDFEVYVAPPDPEPRQPRKGSSNVSSQVVTASPDET